MQECKTVNSQQGKQSARNLLFVEVRFSDETKNLEMLKMP